MSFGKTIKKISLLDYLQTFFNSFFIGLSDCLSLIVSYPGPAVKETTPLFSETHLPGDSSADKTKQSTPPALIQKETSSLSLGINTLLLLFQGK